MTTFDEQYVALRGQFLALGQEPSEQAGPALRGALMDLGMGEACATVVRAADGSTSLYFSSGGGTIGAGVHQAVADAGQGFLGAVEAAMEHFGPVVEDAPPATADGTVQLVAVTSGGLRTLTVPEADAQREGGVAYECYGWGQEVITQIRLIRG